MKRKGLRIILITIGAIVVMSAVSLVTLVVAVGFGSGGSAEREEGGSAVQSAPRSMGIEKKAVMNEAPAVMKTAAEDQAAGGPSETSALQQEKQTEARKRIYSGYAELLVDDTDLTKRRLSRLAEDENGYVESVYRDSITIRIPAQRFSFLFNEILGFGEVLHSHEETVDVTDYYTDLQARLDIAVKTRDRLYKLLEQTEDVKERIKILQEIRRLSEEIEGINKSFQMVKEYIRYSSITVKLKSRLEETDSEEQIIPFPWMRNLHPLYPSITELKGRVTGELPADYAVFKKSKYFRAEASDGTRLRIGTTDNNPAGDAGFWQAALLYHLKNQYASASKEVLGIIPGVLFISKDRDPYYYFVGTIPDKKKLHVVELFFPDKKTLESRFRPLKEIFKGGISVQ